jgi:hypothetical protein
VAVLAGDGVELSAAQAQAAGLELGIWDVEKHAPGGVGILMGGAVDLQHGAAAA